jgi:hypothetical protein
MMKAAGRKRMTNEAHTAYQSCFWTRVAVSMKSMTMMRMPLMPW